MSKLLLMFAALLLLLLIGSQPPTSSAQSSLTNATLRNVRFTSKDGWAVGSDGTILYYNGKQWSKAVSPTTAELYDLELMKVGEGWAVGSGGTILQLKAGKWVQVASPTKADLKSVAMAGVNDGWIVGDNTMLRYVGGKWTQYTLPSELGSGRFTAVYMITPSEGWAVRNQDPYDEGSSIIRYRNGRWQADSPGMILGQDGIDMASSDEGWAVGYEGIFHYKAGKWSYDTASWSDPKLTKEGLPPLYAIYTTVTADAWAAGTSGLILHRVNGHWVESLSNSDRTIYSIYVLRSGEGWAVGEAGTILRYSGGQWSRVSGPAPSLALSSVHMTSATDGWAVGNNGTILHYTGDRWQPVRGPSLLTGLGSVYMTSANEGWAVGPGRDSQREREVGGRGGGPIIVPDLGTILRYKDGQWADTNYPGLDNLHSVVMLNANEGWAVGGRVTSEVGVQASLLHYKDGNWIGELGPDLSKLYDIDMISAAEGWAVGSYANPRLQLQQSMILRYSSGKWVEQYKAKTELLYAVDMVTSSAGWAVGGGTDNKQPASVISRYDAGKWTSSRLPGRTLRAVQMLSATEGWAVGDGGTIYRYQNGNWQQATSPTKADLRGLYLTSASDGWAVGGDTILRLQGGKWSIYK